MAAASAGALLLCQVDAYAMTAVFLLIYAVFISRNVISNGRLFFDNMRAQLQLARQTEIDLAAAEGISGKRQRLALADRRRRAG